MKKNFLILFVLSMLIFSCKQNSNENQNNMANSDQTNPLIARSALQYQAPQFDKIKTEHYKPAFEYGIKQQISQIDSIVNNTEEPTFQNTILPLEISGEVLDRSRAIFYNLLSANTNEDFQKLDEEYAPIFASHEDKIYLNDKLYAKIKKIFDNRANLNLDSEDLRLVELYAQRFEMAGANLSPENKQKLMKINEELATLQSQFNTKLLSARKSAGLLVDNVKDLDGMNPDDIEAAANDAKAAGSEGKYLLSIQNTTQQPLLQSLKNRNIRQKLFEASWKRAEKNDSSDTRAVLEKIAQLRMEKANLMGKKNYAEWGLQDQMAQNPENVFKLLAKLSKPAVAKANEEKKEIQALIDKQKGGFKLEPWDWNFYAEQVRKAKYDLDESQIKPYFEVRNVLEKGVFYAAEKLYGITFKVRKDLPVYHPDVVAYEVFDHDGKSIALYYLDFYTRDNKNGGAWMDNFVQQSHYLNQKPVITNVYNFQKPAPGKPSLISYDDVTTVFHEFGHFLHGLFANQKYTSLSGTATPRDFVEFPSQINEQWALEPSVLKNYAIHYQTKQPIPQALIDKIKKSKSFNEGYAVTEIVAAATLDMAWHTINNKKELMPCNDFENAALKKYSLNMKEVPSRYHTPYFLHIWSNGYSAGYYAYLWSEMLDFDAYKWFEENGGMTRINGDRFRKFILSVGNSLDLNKAYKDFTGRDPEITPMLKGRGLIK